MFIYLIKRNRVADQLTLKEKEELGFSGWPSRSLRRKRTRRSEQWSVETEEGHQPREVGSPHRLGRWEGDSPLEWPETNVALQTPGF